MRRFTLRSIWAHKRRLISTVVAVVLGVAFMSGTFVFSDTLNKVLDDLFAEANENVDARVQGEVLFTSGFGEGDERALLDESLVDAVRDVEGVAGAAPYVWFEGFGPTGRVLDPEGEPLGVNNGPPTILENWLEDDAVNGYVLTEGSRPPETDDEMALDVSATEDGGFELGDRITVTTQFGNKEYTLVGTFTFGDNDSLGGLVAADFTLAEAQRLAGLEGEVNHIVAAADGGVSQEELVERISPILPDDAEALTGEEAAAQDADQVQEGLSFFNQILTIFGTIALIVGAFLITNTFQILVAQRTRELALLRAVGASRGQVLRSVLLEATLIGLVSAILGIAAGIGLAAAITAILRGIGVELPSTSLVIGSNTIVTGLLIGLVVTVLAAIMPAIRATRVAPLAALRDVAVERTGRPRIRLAIAAVVLVFGALNLSQAWTADGDTDALPAVGLGALLIIVGALVVGPLVAGRSVKALGAFLPRLRGVTGKLAVENAARAPKRTSATASALVIGVALIGFVTIFAESAKRSVSAEVDRGVEADLIVQAEGGAFSGFAGFTPEVARAMAEVDGIDTVATFGGAPAHITYPDGHTAETFIGAVEPTAFAEVATAEMAEGAFLDLEPGEVLVDRQIAEDNDLEIGDTVNILVAGGGNADLTIGGISDDLVVLAFWTTTREDFDAMSNQNLDFQIMATVDDGADLDAVKADAIAALDQFPAIDVLDRDEWEGDLAGQLTAFVNFIYGLLALSIIIAMIGVANTLSLSIHERTRELGLLRAVGMERSQVKAAIRWEAVLISLLGTVVGLALGLVASYALVKALEGFGLSRFGLPLGTLIVQVLIAAGFGVLASLLAARRAARLNVLAAIATE